MSLDSVGLPERLIRLGDNSPPSDAEVASNVDQQVSASSSRNPSPKPDKSQLRRIQKRLYMRRKRAEAVGRTPNMEAVKLRPGRQAGERKPRSKTGRKYLSQQDASQNSGDDDPEVNKDMSSAPTNNLPSHGQEDSEDEDNESEYEKSGMTKPYRLKKLFYECGVTAQTLSDMDLEFFSFSALGKLLR